MQSGTLLDTKHSALCRKYLGNLGINSDELWMRCVETTEKPEILQDVRQHWFPSTDLLRSVMLSETQQRNWSNLWRSGNDDTASTHVHVCKQSIAYNTYRTLAPFIFLLDENKKKRNASYEDIIPRIAARIGRTETVKPCTKLYITTYHIPHIRMAACFVDGFRGKAYANLRIAFPPPPVIVKTTETNVVVMETDFDEPPPTEDDESVIPAVTGQEGEIIGAPLVSPGPSVLPDGGMTELQLSLPDQPWSVPEDRVEDTGVALIVYSLPLPKKERETGGGG